MDSGNDEQTQVLRAIWQELKDLGHNLGGRIDTLNSELSARIDALNSELSARIDETNRRLDETRTELSTRIDATNLRLDQVEVTLKELAAQQLMLTRYVANVVDRHEEAIADLRERLGRLEGRSGGH